MTYKVLDTNILLLDATNLYLLAQPDTTVVLSDVVINECDSKKSVLGELGYQARTLGRIISKGTIGEVIKLGTLVVTPVTLDNGGLVHITSCNYPKFDVDDSTINDRKIIHVANVYSTSYPTATTFITNDVICRITAISLGIYATDFKVIEKINYEFIKELEVDLETFNLLQGKLITTVDPSYLPENYNYKFTTPTLNHTKLATIVNGNIDVIEAASEKELRRQDINPGNTEQLFFSKALQDTSIDVVACVALSGSGKTLVAVSNGIRMVTQRKYESIIYIRATVNDTSSQEEEIGFLSTNEAKEAVYLHALHDTLDTIVRSKFKDSKSKGKDLEEKVAVATEKLITDCNIRGMIPLGMRGRTFDNSYIIIDEAQNVSPATMQKILTRVGKNSKVVIIGSQNQIDSKYLTKFSNGLATILDDCTKSNTLVKLHAVPLHKVLRSNITEWAENLFS